MLSVKMIEAGRFTVTLTDEAFGVLINQTHIEQTPAERAEYGELTIPPAEVLRIIIRDGLGLSVNDAADDHAADLDDGMPF